jgi:hypothetical protein
MASSLACLQSEFGLWFIFFDEPLAGFSSAVRFRSHQGTGDAGIATLLYSTTDMEARYLFPEYLSAFTLK